MVGADLFSTRWESSPLPVVIASLHGERRTGTLSVVSPSATRELVFVDGEIRAARSEVESEKLGSWLVSQGVLSEARKQGALLIKEGSDAPPLGHMLVTKEVIDRASLERHLERLAVTIVERATRDRRRTLGFRDGSRAEQLDTLPNQSTPQLILVAARALPHRETSLIRPGHSNQVVRRTGSLDALVQAFELTFEECEILGKLNQPMTLGRLRAAAAIGEERFTRSLFGLATARLILLSSPPERDDSTEVAVRPPARPEPLPRTHRSDGAREERSELRQLAADCPTQDHYALFGLDPGASYQEIYDAWDAARTRFNPERVSEPHLSGLDRVLRTLYEAAEQAYETLSSPVERPRYDRLLRTATDNDMESPTSPAVERTTVQEARAELVSQTLETVDRLVGQGDLFTAIKKMEHLCDLESKPEFLVKLARMMFLNPKWSVRALETLKRAVRKDPHNADGWLCVAEYWRRHTNKERERKALENAIAADPSHQQAIELYRTVAGTRAVENLLARIDRST